MPRERERPMSERMIRDEAGPEDGLNSELLRTNSWTSGRRRREVFWKRRRGSPEEWNAVDDPRRRAPHGLERSKAGVRWGALAQNNTHVHPF